jgi:hypothetical protein
MKIQYFLYILKLKGKKDSRAGALLKLLAADGSLRYADLLPWPEYGDNSIEKEFVEIKAGRFSKLFLRALELSSVSVIGNSKHLTGNHFIISDLSMFKFAEVQELENQGHSVLKLKVGTDLDFETNWLNQMKSLKFRFRLDFNSKLNLEQFKYFIEKLDASMHERIEFIEDPMPYNFSDWRAASELMPLAIDFEYENWVKSNITEVPFNVIVLKPVRQDVFQIIDNTNKLGVNYVVTSSMDAVLGEIQVQNLLPELKNKLGPRLLVGGCKTRHLYEDHMLFSCHNFEELAWSTL